MLPEHRGVSVRFFPNLIVLSVAVVALTACKSQPADGTSGGPAPTSVAGVGSAPGSPGSFTGKVVETMESGGYTYALVDTGSAKIWAAAPKQQVTVGSQVVVPRGMAMKDFESKTLGRTFDVIYFVDSIKAAGAAAPVGEQPMPASPGAAGAAPQGMPPGHGSMGAPAAPAKVDLSGIAKAEGGHTVAEVFANQASLAGKAVSVRGKVVKYNAAIMDRNWLHIQDGSGAAGTNDLTVTSAGTAAVGQTVVVKGILAVDKDFGSGYKYDVLIEKATIAVE